MIKHIRKTILFPLALLMLFIIPLSLVGCGEKDNTPLKADVKITIVNKNDLPVVNTEITVSNITDAEIAYTYTTDSNGQFTIINLGERELTFIIHSEDGNYNAKHAVSKSEIEEGALTVKFNDYE